MFDYASQPPHWINRAAFALQAELGAAFAAAGHAVTAREWALLMVLWEAKAMSVGELAAHTMRDRTTVTRMLDRLDRKGWIVRSASGADRRSIEISLTPAGRALEEPLTTIAGEMIGRALAGIPRETLLELNATLARIVANLEPAPPAESPE